MNRTIADKLRDQGRKVSWKEAWKEGWKEGIKMEAVQTRRQVLLHLLRQRFEELPPPTIAKIESTTSKEQLNTWLGRIIKAKSLEEIGIGQEH
jgi:hypothetical protein